MDLGTWLAFFAAAWAISLTPGAGAIAAMSAGLSHGFARGYAVAFGLVLGIWTQVVVVGLGLGALIATSSLAFSAIKWAGVAYLVWLGWKQWTAPAVALTEAADDAPLASPRALILRGWIVNALNPKGTIFMLAVVPQFLDPARALLPQYALIALTLAATDLVVMGGYIGLAARVLRLLRSPAQVRVLNRTFGSLFIAAGALLALFKRA
jgi:homoserine/homoserine lactone efflux protein